MKKPNAIAVFLKPDYENDVPYLKKAVTVLTSGGTHTYLHTKLRPYFEKKTAYLHFLSDEHALIDVCDMLLVLGGDGTMLDYAVRAAEKSKPVAGINCGHLGFLTAMEKTEIQKLSEIIAGNYELEERMLLDVQIEIDSFSSTYHAMNEVVVASGVRSKIAEFSLLGKSGKLLDYRADGLIIATPTGSTAYSLSAGGPVIDPVASLLSVTPICPHSLLRGSVILSSDTTLTLSGETKDERSDIYFAVDGKHGQLLNKNAKIHIEKSKYTAGIVKIGENRFYDILQTKLNRK